MEKELYKSVDNKMLAGVCGGIAEYFSIDPTIVRLAGVLFCALAAAAFWPTSSPSSSPRGQGYADYLIQRRV